MTDSASAGGLKGIHLSACRLLDAVAAADRTLVMIEGARHRCARLFGR